MLLQERMRNDEEKIHRNDSLERLEIARGKSDELFLYSDSDQVLNRLIIIYSTIFEDDVWSCMPPEPTVFIGVTSQSFPHLFRYQCSDFGGGREPWNQMK